MAPNPAPAAQRPPPLAGCGATAIVFAAVSAGGALAVLLRTPGSRLPLSLLIPSVVVLFALVALNVTRGALGPRSGISLGLVALSAVAPIAVGARSALGEPLVTWWRRDDGYGDLTPLVAEVLFCVVFVIAAPVATVTATRAGPVILRSIRRLTLLVVAASLALVAAAAPRAFQRSDPDSYVRNLPVVIAIPSAASASDFEATSGPAHVRRLGADCSFDLDIEPDVHETLRGRAMSPCVAMALRRDDVGGYWVFTNESERAPLPMIAIDASSTQTTGIRVDGIARQLAAPIGWIVEALVGALVAAALLALSRWRRPREIAARLAALQATHLGAGQVELGDGSPPFLVEAATPLTPGPVLLLGASPRNAAYRGDPAGPIVPAAVVPGTHQGMQAYVAEAQASDAAFALAVAVLASAPLVVAAAAGLVL